MVLLLSSRNEGKSNCTMRSNTSFLVANVLPTFKPSTLGYIFDKKFLQARVSFLCGIAAPLSIDAGTKSNEKSHSIFFPLSLVSFLPFSRVRRGGAAPVRTSPTSERPNRNQSMIDRLTAVRPHTC
jgi:hypothetical protein